MIETQLVTLGILFFFAILAGLLANRMKQPVVLALLLVGTLIGPYSLGLLEDKELIDMVIEFGTILLLFVIGMEFSVKKLMKVGFKALIVSLFKVAISFFAGFVTSLLLGLGMVAGVFIGIIISFTSTVVVVKVLEQKDMLHRKEMPLLLGVLILEDIFAVVAITFFSGIVPGSGMNIFSTIQQLLFGITVLVLVFLIANKFAEKLVEWVLKNNSGEEVITFLSLGLCLGFAYLAYLLGLSTAAGAFLAGSIVSTFRDSKSFERAVHPYMQIFSSLFFLAIGTLINLSSISQYWVIILVLLGVLLVTRYISVGISTYIFANFKTEEMLFSSIAMFSVGEFSLLIARQATAFNPGIDLVTISAIIIFVTAVFMSIALKYNSFIQTILNKSRQAHVLTSMSNISHYIRSMFDELDTEDGYTRRLREKVYSMFGQFFLIIFILISSNKLISYIANLIASKIYSYIIVGLSVLAIIFFVIRFYREIKEAQILLVHLLSNIDPRRDTARTKRVIRNMLLGLFLLIFGLFSPLIIFAFNLNIYFIIASFVLIFSGIIHFVRLFIIIRRFTRG
jgi:CPA2 family monovalent cation:H+ antiporter-2